LGIDTYFRFKTAVGEFISDFYKDVILRRLTAYIVLVTFEWKNLRRKLFDRAPPFAILS